MCEVASRSTDFSVCAFLITQHKSKPHRLKPVLLDLRRIRVRNAEWTISSILGNPLKTESLLRADSDSPIVLHFSIAAG
jgi:hypothetical protein